ncbi:odorant receptor 128-10 [Syngnathoides biaculeatus]|uniref:odorant receptor 128-10 n=1 Tax=Syngnathoides biaculeatus TaxID=300417 RepID=UPI002ADE8E1C|nr:odorant receptor 128-10 [Syngnathoides biaculeatus]
MSNVTYSYFVLSLYGQLGAARYLAFAATVSTYALAVASNASLVALICWDGGLRARPMFVLAASLFANQLLGSTAFFPFLAAQTLSSSHAVSPASCFLQIFALYSYARVELCTLAAMSYDRYLAICRPLRYAALMAPGRAPLVVLSLWAYSMAWVAVAVAITAGRPLCGNVIPGLYCHNFLVARLLCGDSRASDVYGLVATAAAVVAPLLPVLYSYARILAVVFSGRRRARRKALATCVPHVASLVNFCFGCTFQVVRTRFDVDALPHVLRDFLSLYFVLVQPILDPLVYGGQMTQIRQGFAKFLRGRDGVRRPERTRATAETKDAQRRK